MNKHFKKLAVASVVALPLSLAFAGGAIEQEATVLGQTSTDCSQVPLPFFDPRPVIEGASATLLRTPNGISGFVSMDTPVSGGYCYPPMTIAGDASAGPAVPGHPEAFTLWIIYFNEPQNCASGDGDDCDVPDVLGENCANAQAGAMKLSGHIKGGGKLNLSGHLSAGDGPLGALGCAPLYNVNGAEVHLAVAPHGMPISSAMPTQIQVPPGGGPGYWYPAIFEAVN
jgi:hypothetical protein